MAGRMAHMFPVSQLRDGVWAWLMFAPLLGMTQNCDVWLHDSCPEPADCVCRCHGTRWKEFRL